MVQGYYTLQEAAQVLALPPDELKQMAQRNQIRSFQDRGNLRFRVQDIQELARQRGAASDMDLPLGESTPRAAQPKSGPRSGPKSGPRTPGKTPRPQSPAPKAPDVFDFAVDTGQEEQDFGLSLFESPSGTAPKSGKKSPSPKPIPGSDSDVKLVADGSNMAIAVGSDSPKKPSDSDVKMVGHSDSDVKMVPDVPRTPPAGARKSMLGGQATPPLPRQVKSSTPPATPDSGVRLVPPDSDSDVKIVQATDADMVLGDKLSKGATDSDIRLEFPLPPSDRSNEGALTEEINLDEELRKQEALARKPQAKVKPKSKFPKVTQTSPFELSDFDAPPKLADQKKPVSSDYDLTPGKGGQDSSDDFSLELPDDSSDFHIPLDSNEGPMAGPSSGISLGNPVDSGISLEQGKEGNDDIEFELTLDAGQATPKPSTPKPVAGQDVDSDSEFELSLDADDSVIQPAAGDDSGSEFELTLDDSGGLVPEEDAPQAKAKAAPAKDKDIFDSDFELGDDSGSQVAALDTDLESSDFDLTGDDSDIAVDEGSGSQVVALDEEEADEAAATVSAKKRKAAADDDEAGDEDFSAIADDEVDVDEEAPGAGARTVRVPVPVPAAPWGIMPVLLMLPCVVVMVLVGLMGFEMLQQMTGYKPPGFLTKTIGDLMNLNLK